MALTKVQKKVHSNGQISLGKDWGGRDVQVEYVGPNEIRIRAGAVAFIPEEHRAFFTPEALEQVADFSRWEETTPPQTSDIQAFRHEITRRRAKSK